MLQNIQAHQRKPVIRNTCVLCNIPRVNPKLTKVRIGRGYLWGSFLIAAAALKTPTRNGYNAQGVNLKLRLGFTLLPNPLPFKGALCA